MIRTQVQLTEQQAKALKRAAVKRGMAVSALVREAVDRVIEERIENVRWSRALAAVGSRRGGGENVSEEHDRYLVDAYKR